MGQNQFGPKCWKSQFWLFQLSITRWLSVHPSLFRWVLLTGCLWAASQQLEGSCCYLHWLHSCVQIWQALTENTLLLPPGPYTGGDLRVHNNQNKPTGRPSFCKTIFPKAGGEETIFRVQSWGVACPALGKGSLHLYCYVLSWENKQSTGRCYSRGLCESCGLQQSCCKVLG